MSVIENLYLFEETLLTQKQLEEYENCPAQEKLTEYISTLSKTQLDKFKEFLDAYEYERNEREVELYKKGFKKGFELANELK